MTAGNGERRERKRTAAMETQSYGMGKIPQMVKKSPALRVLVVDDEPLIRWSLGEALTDSGCTVIEGSDARSARRAIEEASERFDVILLDFRLPDSNDLSLLESVRRLMPDTPVILMTAYGTPETVAGAIKLGAYRVVSKPFEIADMVDLVAEAGGDARSV
ncbi:MAG TPA: response regulator [Vicinamibacterales bacterium]|nr:response regulator [Vicinamibacterales bacterium]